MVKESEMGAREVLLIKCRNDMCGLHRMLGCRLEGHGRSY